MTGKQDTGFDPETIFDEGRIVGQSEADEQLREQIAEQLVTQGGFDPDEVQELLFDPAPRRGRRGGRNGKRHCSAKQWKKMPQICRGTGGSRVRTARHPVMVYDPAPPGGYRAVARRYYRKKGGAKGLVAGLKPLVLPGAALATIYSKYSERATTLKAAGAQVGTPPHAVDGVWDALMYDLKNRPTTSVMDRIKANASGIVVPMLVGGAYKGYLKGKVKLHPKVNQVLDMGAEGAIGAGIGNLINAILDPPSQQPQQQQTQTQPQTSSVMQPESVLNYMPLSMRGY